MAAVVALAYPVWAINYDLDTFFHCIGFQNPFYREIVAKFDSDPKTTAQIETLKKIPHVILVEPLTFEEWRHWSAGVRAATVNGGSAGLVSELPPFEVMPYARDPDSEPIFESEQFRAANHLYATSPLSGQPSPRRLGYTSQDVVISESLLEPAASRPSNLKLLIYRRVTAGRTLDAIPLQIAAVIPGKMGFGNRIMVHPDLLIKAERYLDHGESVNFEQGVSVAQSEQFGGVRIGVDEAESVPEVVRQVAQELQVDASLVTPTSGTALQKTVDMREQFRWTLRISGLLVLTVWLVTVWIFGRNEILMFRDDFQELSSLGYRWRQIAIVAVVPVVLLSVAAGLMSVLAVTLMPRLDGVRLVFTHLSTLPGSSQHDCASVFHQQSLSSYVYIGILGLAAIGAGCGGVYSGIRRVLAGRG